MHSCPICDKACTCNGDIDDIDWSDPAAQADCTCCKEREESDPEEEVECACGIPLSRCMMGVGECPDGEYTRNW